MRGVRFGVYHTAEDWGLILNDKSLTPPVPKTTYIQVEGRDGDLDFSEALTGEIRYNNRVASFTFLATDGTYTDREELISEILGALHGKKVTIVLDDKPDYYLVGRCQVTEVTNNKAYGTIKVNCNCEPWFCRSINTVRSFTISGTTDITLTNTGGRVLTPTVDVTGSITLSFNDSSVSLTDGSYKLTDLKLRSGNTVLTANGSGTVTFTYREGVL